MSHSSEAVLEAPASRPDLNQRSAPGLNFAIVGLVVAGILYSAFSPSPYTQLPPLYPCMPNS